jgi:thioesterase domain-containing protein/aryl carrier-like protein
VNEYGPTETTITATAYCCRPEDVQASFIPIGRPVANTRIYLQDLAGNVLPDGVAGEICIAGAGVSKGYLNKPELTALKFVPDPVVPGAWMYRTGDKGCWLPDGQLAYLGRMDEQVKIRGYRIEPGEVESVLQRSGLVQHATVKAEKDAGGHLQLFAYVQLATGVERTVLADWLRTQLPAYMLPARIICLDVMPLTNSGKVNKQLLTPQHTSEESPAQHELPVGPVQTFIATCWKELLGISEVGIYQQFFELGGHSLLLLQLLSRIRKAGYTVQLRDLYENRTIASLSAHLQPNGLHASTDHLLLLRQEAGDIPVFIMPGSDGVSDGYDELAMALPGQYTVYGIQMMGMFEGERALDTIPAIAAQHIAWIKSIQPSGPYRLLGHSFGAYVTYEMVKQLEQQEEEVAFAWLLDAPCPFIPDVVRAADRKAFGWHEVVQLLEQQQVITKAHPVWFTTLKTAAMQLALPDMIHYIIAALVPYTGLRQEYIAFSLRLLHLRMMNTGAPYTPHGDVRAPFVLVKAAEQRWEIHAPAMGWANYIPHIREVSSAGNHFNMVKGKHAEVLASVLADQLHVGS